MKEAQKQIPECSQERMIADFPALQQFHTKHALGSLMPPSCLCCGKTANEIAVRHLELPAIVICKDCKDKVAAIDREIALRQELEAAKAEIEQQKDVDRTAEIEGALRVDMILNGFKSTIVISAAALDATGPGTHLVAMSCEEQFNKLHAAMTDRENP